ncbi:MAG: FHA domain-containing protein [Proteobacteria bacterium]|nr:FHA domain-containing protein [Pseudomonadota bacterium]
MLRIVLKFKGQIVKEIPFKGNIITIGRDKGNDIEIENPIVSSIHARILKDGGAIVIEDAGSTNGIFLNGEKITRAILSTTDEVAIGKHHISLAYEAGYKEGGETDDDSPLTPVTPSLDETMIMTGKARAVAQGRTGGFILLDGGIEEFRVELTDRVSTIGKSGDAVIKTKGLFAPKVAALVNKTDKGYVISASNPKKAPLINGTYISEAYILKENDLVKIDSLTLRFYLK